MWYVCLIRIYKQIVQFKSIFILGTFQKEKIKPKSMDAIATQKYQKFKQAMGLSGDEDGSTD